MIDLYYWPTPNGKKIAIMLEECDLEYTLVPVNIGVGEQFEPEFLKISPNNRIPAIVDRETGISVFEGGAILVWLRKAAGFFHSKELTGLKFCSGCSGRRAASVRWPDSTVTSSAMRRIRRRTPRTVIFESTVDCSP